MIACWHGLSTDLPTLRERFPISTQGMTLQKLTQCAADLRLSSRAVRLELEDLRALALPCILHWNMNHFVVLHKIRGNRLTLHDPDRGKVTLSLSEAGKHFTGIALELTPTAGFAPRDERQKIKLRQLTGKTSGLLPAMVRILIFALALGTPLLNQLVIDEVLVVADRNLLTLVIAALTVSPGEVVAITGKSGCGKSTLVKLILGIHMPGAGEIRAFGVPHTHPHYVQVRPHIGTVLQDDQLFRGSIADNIIFFSETRDQAHMAWCAKMALIDVDIMAMPMGYQTLVGETGGTLSGGQKQRILLARALYKRPGFLLLDEATSHLDVESEILIGQTLRASGITVLLIAHRQETLASADRVLFMDGGKFLRQITAHGES